MKITWDFDSTLCNMMPPWYQWLVDNGYTTHLHTDEEITAYDFLHKTYGESVKGYFLNDPFDCYSKIHPYEGAADILNWCCQNFDDVEIVTHSCQKATEIAKREYIRHHFGFTNVRFFSVLHEKFNHIANSILIDDYPFHCIKHAAVNKNHAIVFDYEGKNGWSKVESYIPLILEENPELDLLLEAKNYVDVKDILRGFL